MSAGAQETLSTNKKDAHNPHRIRAIGTQLSSMAFEPDDEMGNGNEADGTVAIKLKKTTGITISLGLLICIVVASWKFGQFDANRTRDYEALRQLAESNAVALTELKDSTIKMSDTLERLEGASADRWTRSHMRKLVKEFGKANPDLTLPDVDEIVATQ